MFKKFVIGLLLFVVNAVPTIALAGIWLVALGAPSQFAQVRLKDSLEIHRLPAEPGGQDTFSSRANNPPVLSSTASVILSLAVVVVIFALSVTVLWALSKIGGPLSGDVKATISKFGGKVSIAAAAVVGAFLAIAITGVATVFLFLRYFA